MLRKVSVGLAALAAVGFAGSAMAQQINPQNYNVNVNIQVAEEVSMWAGHQNIALVLEGNDGNNFDGEASTITHINNTAANIAVSVTGGLTGDPVTGKGLWFYIFDGGTVASAQAAMAANAYAPANAKVWSAANVGTPQSFVTNLPVATSAVTRNVVYAAATPGDLPMPQMFDLDVVWTISDATP